MELRDLVAFVTVAEKLHFTRAAEHLFMSQPPLTRQIKALEKELGFDLFNRSTRSVELTVPGTAFLEYAKRVVQTSTQATWAAEQIARGNLGCLEIGFVGSAALEVFPSLIPDFRRRSPEIELRINEMNSGQQVSALLESEIDVGFSRGDNPVEDLASFVVSRSPLVAALPAAHRAASREVIDVAELSGERFVMYPKRHYRSLYDEIDGLCRAAGFIPKVEQHASAVHTVVSLVSAGIGVAIVPEAVSRLALTGVRYLPLAGEPMTEVRASYRASGTNPALRRFLDYVSEMAPVRPARSMAS